MCTLHYFGALCSYAELCRRRLAYPQSHVRGRKREGERDRRERGREREGERERERLLAFPQSHVRERGCWHFHGTIAVEILPRSLPRRTFIDGHGTPLKLPEDPSRTRKVPHFILHRNSPHTASRSCREQCRKTPPSNKNEQKKNPYEQRKKRSQARLAKPCQKGTRGAGRQRKAGGRRQQRTNIRFPKPPPRETKEPMKTLERRALN